MDVVKVTRQKTMGALLAYELNAIFCREAAILLAGDGDERVAKQFSLVMLVGLSAAAAAAAGNTGTGAFGAVTADDGAKLGEYRIVCTEPAANAGTFEVEDPDGIVIGKANVGVAFNGPINFTIADGGADFIAGDSFTVTVTDSDAIGKCIAWDGAGQIHGVVLYDATATDDADADLVVLRRGPAIIVKDELVWHAGVTNGQKALAYAQLEAKGILTRS